MTLSNSARCVIGLSGLVGSGKGYVGGAVGTEHAFARIAFGDGLKRALSALDPAI